MLGHQKPSNEYYLIKQCGILPWPIFLSFLNPEAYRFILCRLPCKLILAHHTNKLYVIYDKFSNKRMTYKTSNLITFSTIT